MYAKKKEGWTHDLAVQGRCVQTWGLEFGSQHTHTQQMVYMCFYAIVIKHHNQSNFRKKGVIWFTLPYHSPSLKKVRARSL